MTDPLSALPLDVGRYDFLIHLLICISTKHSYHDATLEIDGMLYFFIICMNALGLYLYHLLFLCFLCAEIHQ